MARYNFLEIPAELANIREQLDKKGVVYFRNAPAEPKAFLNVCSEFGEIYREGSSASDGISRIVYNVARAQESSGNAYSRQALFPHTDRSGVKHPPRVLINVIVKNAGTGGISTFVPADKLVEKLRSEYPNLLAILCRPDVAAFRRKDNVLMAPIIDLADTGMPRMRFRNDDGLYISKQLEPRLDILLKLITSLTTKRSFADGEGYIVDNRRILHGRTRFFGIREVWRVLVK